jgi:hypothetical protein
MALCVPAVAWIEASALMIVLISVAALGIGVVLGGTGTRAAPKRPDRTGRSGVDALKRDSRSRRCFLKVLAQRAYECEGTPHSDSECAETQGFFHDTLRPRAR